VSNFNEVKAEIIIVVIIKTIARALGHPTIAGGPKH